MEKPDLEKSNAFQHDLGLVDNIMISAPYYLTCVRKARAMQEAAYRSSFTEKIDAQTPRVVRDVPISECFAVSRLFSAACKEVYDLLRPDITFSPNVPVPKQLRLLNRKNALELLLQPPPPTPTNSPTEKELASQSPLLPQYSCYRLNQSAQRLLEFTAAQLAGPVPWARRLATLEECFTPHHRTVASGILNYVAANLWERRRDDPMAARGVEGFLPLDLDSRSFVSPAEGIFVHVWHSAAEARQFISSSQRLWQVLFEYGLRPFTAPISTHIVVRGTALTFTGLVPIVGAPLSVDTDDEIWSTAAGSCVQSLRMLLGWRPFHDFSNPELYLGADARYYFADPTQFGVSLSFGAPPEPPVLLRREAFPVVFPNGIRDPVEVKNRTDLVDAVQTTVIRSAVVALRKTTVKTLREMLHNGVVANTLHDHGVSMRLLGLVRAELLQQLPKPAAIHTPFEAALVDAVECEMLCRGLKEIVRSEICVNVHETEADATQRANRLMRYLSLGSFPVFTQLLHVVRTKFVCPELDLHFQPKYAKVLGWYCTPFLGLSYDPKAERFTGFGFTPKVTKGLFNVPNILYLSTWKNQSKEETQQQINAEWARASKIAINPMVREYPVMIEKTMRCCRVIFLEALLKLNFTVHVRELQEALGAFFGHMIQAARPKTAPRKTQSVRITEPAVPTRPDSAPTEGSPSRLRSVVSSIITRKRQVSISQPADPPSSRPSFRDTGGALRSTKSFVFPELAKGTLLLSWDLPYYFLQARLYDVIMQSVEASTAPIPRYKRRLNLMDDVFSDEAATADHNLWYVASQYRCIASTLPEDQTELRDELIDQAGAYLLHRHTSLLLQIAPISQNPLTRITAAFDLRCNADMCSDLFRLADADTGEPPTRCMITLQAVVLGYALRRKVMDADRITQMAHLLSRRWVKRAVTAFLDSQQAKQPMPKEILLMLAQQRFEYSAAHVLHDSENKTTPARDDPRVGLAFVRALMLHVLFYNQVDQPILAEDDREAHVTSCSIVNDTPVAQGRTDESGVNVLREFIDTDTFCDIVLTSFRNVLLPQRRFLEINWIKENMKEGLLYEAAQTNEEFQEVLSGAENIMRPVGRNQGAFQDTEIQLRAEIEAEMLEEFAPIVKSEAIMSAAYFMCCAAVEWYPLNAVQTKRQVVPQWRFGWAALLERFVEEGKRSITTDARLIQMEFFETCDEEAERILRSQLLVCEWAEWEARANIGMEEIEELAICAKNTEMEEEVREFSCLVRFITEAVNGGDAADVINTIQVCEHPHGALWLDGDRYARDQIIKEYAGEMLPIAATAGIQGAQLLSPLFLGELRTHARNGRRWPTRRDLMRAEAIERMETYFQWDYIIGTASQYRNYMLLVPAMVVENAEVEAAGIPEDVLAFTFFQYRCYLLHKHSVLRTIEEEAEQRRALQDSEILIFVNYCANETKELIVMESETEFLQITMDFLSPLDESVADRALENVTAAYCHSVAFEENILYDEISCMYALATVEAFAAEALRILHEEEAPEFYQLAIQATVATESVQRSEIEPQEEIASKALEQEHVYIQQILLPRMQLCMKEGKARARNEAKRIPFLFEAADKAKQIELHSAPWATCTMIATFLVSPEAQAIPPEIDRLAFEYAQFHISSAQSLTRLWIECQFHLELAPFEEATARGAIQMEEPSERMQFAQDQLEEIEAIHRRSIEVDQHEVRGDFVNQFIEVFLPLIESSTRLRITRKGKSFKEIRRQEAASLAEAKMRMRRREMEESEASARCKLLLKAWSKYLEIDDKMRVKEFFGDFWPALFSQHIEVCLEDVVRCEPTPRAQIEQEFEEFIEGIRDDELDLWRQENAMNLERKVSNLAVQVHNIPQVQAQLRRHVSLLQFAYHATKLFQRIGRACFIRCFFTRLPQICHLQLMGRGYVARREVGELRTLTATLRLQRCSRGFLDRELMYEARMQHIAYLAYMRRLRMISASKIQWFFRRQKARRIAERHQKGARWSVRWGTICRAVQRCARYRASVSRALQLRDALWLRAALLFQRISRGGATRRQLGFYDFKHSTMAVQRRLHRLAHFAQQEFPRRRQRAPLRFATASPVLQRTRHLYLDQGPKHAMGAQLHEAMLGQLVIDIRQRKKDLEWEARMQEISDAAEIYVPMFHRVGRGYLGRKRLARIRVRRAEKLLPIQAFLRGVRSMKAVNYIAWRGIQHIRNAQINHRLILVQSHLRVRHSTKVVGDQALFAKELALKKLQGTRVLQRIGRGLITRKLAAAERARRCRLCTLIQAALRNRSSSIFVAQTHRQWQYTIAFGNRDKAARKLQHWWKRHYRSWVFAAVCIQRVWLNRRKHLFTLYEHRRALCAFHQVRRGELSRLECNSRHALLNDENDQRKACFLDFLCGFPEHPLLRGVLLPFEFIVEEDVHRLAVVHSEGEEFRRVAAKERLIEREILSRQKGERMKEALVQCHRTETALRKRIEQAHCLIRRALALAFREGLRKLRETKRRQRPESATAATVLPPPSRTRRPSSSTLPLRPLERAPAVVTSVVESDRLGEIADSSGLTVLWQQCIGAIVFVPPSELDCSKAKIDDRTVETIFEKIQSLSLPITTLNLSRCSLTAVGLAKLLHFLSANSIPISTLNFTNSMTLTDNCILHIAKYVPRIPPLVEVILTGAPVSIQKRQFILHAIQDKKMRSASGASLKAEFFGIELAPLRVPGSRPGSASLGRNPLAAPLPPRPTKK